jgi:hypothetical protein
MFRDLGNQLAVISLSSKSAPVKVSLSASDQDVRVKACSVNPIDIKIRAGIYDNAPGRVLIQNFTPSALGYILTKRKITISLHQRASISSDTTVPELF